MSEDNNDLTPTPPALIPPPVRGTEADAAAPSPAEVQPESPVDPHSEPSQSEIAAEQAEASLDARDEASSDSPVDSSAEPLAYEPVDSPSDSVSDPADRDDHAHRDSADSADRDGDGHRDSADRDHDTAGNTTVIPAAAGVVGAGAVSPAFEPQTSGRAPDNNSSQQPFVQQRAFTPPPVAPKKKGNRVVGALIAVLSVVVFMVIFAIVAAIVIAVGAPGESVVANLAKFFASPVFYVPAIFFIIGFVLVVLLANRANWWAYILGSLFVAALVYFGTITVGLLINNVVVMTPAQAAAEFAQSAANPFVIAAALVAREVSMWIGAAIAARGRRMKTRNLTAREEYERAAAEHRADYERGFAPA